MGDEPVAASDNDPSLLVDIMCQLVRLHPSLFPHSLMLVRTIAFADRSLSQQWPIDGEDRLQRRRWAACDKERIAWMKEDKSHEGGEGRGERGGLTLGEDGTHLPSDAHREYVTSTHLPTFAFQDTHELWLERLAVIKLTTSLIKELRQVIVEGDSGARRADQQQGRGETGGSQNTSSSTSCVPPSELLPTVTPSFCSSTPSDSSSPSFSSMSPSSSVRLAMLLSSLSTSSSDEYMHHLSSGSETFIRVVEEWPDSFELLEAHVRAWRQASGNINIDDNNDTSGHWYAGNIIIDEAASEYVESGRSHPLPLTSHSTKHDHNGGTNVTGNSDNEPPMAMIPMRLMTPGEMANHALRQLEMIQQGVDEGDDSSSTSLQRQVQEQQCGGMSSADILQQALLLPYHLPSSKRFSSLHHPSHTHDHESVSVEPSASFFSSSPTSPSCTISSTPASSWPQQPVLRDAEAALVHLQLYSITLKGYAKQEEKRKWETETVAGRVVSAAKNAVEMVGYLVLVLLGKHK